MEGNIEREEGLNTLVASTNQALGISKVTVRYGEKHIIEFDNKEAAEY